MGILAKKIIVALVLIIGAFFVGMLAFNFIFMPWFVKLGKEVEVPDVLGKSLQEAEAILSQAKLNYYVQSQIFDPVIPKGFIARQNPAPGRKVKEGKRVYLIVSSGPQIVKVPDLKGVRLEQAERLINLAGLKLGNIVWIYSDSISKGDVIASNPTSGEELPLGKPVGLIVSKGKEKKSFSMPSLIGLSVAEAKTIIETEGLVLGKIKSIDTEGIEENVVLLQGPQPGELVEEGDTVELGVSSALSEP